MNTAEKAAAKAAEKDSNDLDAVAGNAEDDIGELIAGIREKELLYGDKSLLAMYGPLIAHICASPKRYRVSLPHKTGETAMLMRLHPVPFPSPSCSPLAYEAHVRQRAIL